MLGMLSLRVIDAAATFFAVVTLIFMPYAATPLIASLF